MEDFNFSKINIDEFIDDYYGNFRYFSCKLEAKIDNGIVAKKCKPPTGWNKINQEYNEKHNALCLITGEKSNLYIVDYDIKNMYEEDFKKFPELGHSLKQTNKGFHCYFKWSKKAQEILGNSNTKFKVDFRGEGAFVFAYPTQYSDNENNIYKYNILSDNPLQEMSDELIEYLNNSYKNAKVEKKEVISKKEVVDKKITKLHMTYINQCLKKYKQFDVYKIEKIDDEIIRIDFKNNPNVECPLNKGHTHKSNRQYILLNIITFQYKFKCYSGKCIGKNNHHFSEIRHKLIFNRDIVERYFPNKMKNAENANSRLVKKYMIMTVEYVNLFFVNITGMSSNVILYVSYEETGEKKISYKNLNSLRDLILGVIWVELQFNKDSEEDKKDILKYSIYDLWRFSKYRHDKLNIACMPKLELLKDDEYNIFDKFAIDKEDSKNHKEDINHFLNHIKYIFCKGDEECYNYVINWLAYTLQFPENKIAVAIVLLSVEGAGKGVILSKIAEIMGEKYFLACQDFGDVMGNFNGQLEGKFLTFLDECVWGGNKKNGEDGKLKTFITEKQRRINRKNVPAYTAPMYNNVIIATNEDWAIPAGKGQRRYFCLELDNKYSGKSNDEKKEYFKKIINTCPKSLANYLYNVDLTGFNPREFPETETSKQQQSMSLNSVESYVEAYIKNDVEIHTYESPSECLFSDDVKGDKLPRPDIYESYKSYCKDNAVYQVSNGKFWIMIKKIFPWMKDKNYIKKIKGIYYIVMKNKQELAKDWLNYMRVESWDFS